MAEALYTIICEFRGGTYICQVRAPGEDEAVRRWAVVFAEDRPVPRLSKRIADNVLRVFEEHGLAALTGLENVWCFDASAGGDFVLGNVVRSG